MIEPPLAARAAENASEEEIARLEEILRRQAEKTRRGETIIEEDSDFHSRSRSPPGTAWCGAWWTC
jgi:DNA-binding FadR family transcriptional regulator